MAVRVQKMGPGVLLLGQPGDPVSAILEHSFGAQITECSFDPGAKVGDSRPVLSGEVVAGEYTETPTLKGKMLSDWNIAYTADDPADTGTDGIAIWLTSNRGSTVPFYFEPNSAVTSGKGIRGLLVVQPPVIGGTVGSSDPIDFSFTVVDYDLSGKPTSS